MKHLVENASDEIEIGKANEIIKRRNLQNKEDMKFILRSQQGRRFLWRLMEHCKVFNSIYHSSSLIHYNAGKQDVGHFILAEIVNSDENALINMMKEAKGEE